MSGLSDVDLDRLFEGDEPRWIGVTPPDSDYLDKVEFLAGYYATRYADAVVDGGDQWRIDYRRAEYLHARQQLRIAQNAHERMWVDAGRQGRFAGWLIRP